MLIIYIFCLLLVGELSFAFEDSKKAQVSIVIEGVLKKRARIKNRFRPLEKGQFIRVGDILKTDENGRVKITLFNNKTTLILYPKSYLEFKEISDYELNINLVYGKVLVYSAVKEVNGKGYIIKLDTPYSITHSTKGVSHVLLESNNYRDKISVLKSTFNVRSKGFIGGIVLAENHYIVIVDGVNAKKRNIRKIDKEDLSINEDLFNGYEGLDRFDLEYTKVNNYPFFKVETSYVDKILAIKKFREKGIFYFKFEGGFQYIAEDFYFYFSLNPLLTVEKLKLQFRLSFYMPFVNPGSFENWYNYNEWNFSSTADIFEDLLTKIDYLSYGRKGSFYLLISDISFVTLGQGLTVHRYTNEIEFPKRRRVGFFYDLDFKTIRLVGFLSDLTRFEVMGIRIESLPFYGPSKKVYDNTIFGVVFSMDSSPKNNGGNPRVFLFSLDINVPLLSKRPSDISLSVFFEVAAQSYLFTDSGTAGKFGTVANKFHFIDDSFGLLFGFKGTFLDYGRYRLEYRYFPGGYISKYYDTFYELNRGERANQLLAKDKDDFHGFLIRFGTVIPNILDLYVEYYYESGEVSGYDKANHSFYIELNTSKHFSPLFMVKLRYSRRDFKGIEDFFLDFFGSNSYLTLEGQYSFNKNFELIVGFHTFFTSRYVDRDQVFITVRGIF